MNGALKNQTILSAILNVATHPVLRKFGQIQRLRITRTFTAAILKKTPSGFSVLFAPEPDETKTLAYIKAPSKEAKPKKNSEKDTKSKEKPAIKPKRVKKSAKEAEGVKALQGQKNITVLRIDGSPDHALPIAVSEQSTTSPQIKGRKHTPIQQPEDKATCETSVAGSRYHKPAGQQLDDEAFITDDLAAESFESEDHRSAALGGAEEHEKTVPPGDSHSVAAKRKERSEARKKRAADGITGSRFALDQTPIKPVSPAELAQRATPSSAKKAKQDSRDPQSSSKELRSPSPVRKAIQTDHKADFKSKTALLNKPLSTKKEPWQVQKQALKKKFGSEGWKPRKKLSPDTIEGIRALHEQFPDKYSTPILAEKFKVSPEAIRRILKSRWRPDPEKQAERRERWARRHDRIWDQQAAIGLRPARSKTKEPKELGDSDENVDIEEFHLARSRKQARDIHFADDTWT